MQNDQQILGSLRSAMPPFGRMYDIPVTAIDQISMPCMNIGPWGKDFHKLTEHVLKQDLYERNPRSIQCAIETILK